MAKAARFIPQYAMIRDDVLDIIARSDSFDAANGTRVGCAIEYYTVKGEVRRQRVTRSLLSAESTERKTGNEYSVDYTKTDQIRFEVIADRISGEVFAPGVWKSALATNVTKCGENAE